MSTYKRKSGRYAVLIDLEATATGLRRRKSVGTFRTRKEAEAAERKALEARDRGIDLSPKTVTVADFSTASSPTVARKAGRFERSCATRSLRSTRSLRTSAAFHLRSSRRLTFPLGSQRFGSAAA